MTMSKKRTMAAAAFKAQCLAVLDRVEETGETVVVTRRGRAVAEVVPVRRSKTRSLKGSVRTNFDVVGPILGSWDVES